MLVMSALAPGQGRREWAVKNLWRTLALMSVLGCGDGSAPGDSCNPQLGNRDCQPGLACVYVYDECPEYGCPQCRRQCKTNADCSADDGCDPPTCVLNTNTGAADHGVCKTCRRPKAWYQL